MEGSARPPGIAAVLTWLAGFLVGFGLSGLSRLARRRRDHDPRAERIALQLPRPRRTFVEQWSTGQATIRGECAWCGGDWDRCAGELGCVGRRRPG